MHFVCSSVFSTFSFCGCLPEVAGPNKGNAELVIIEWKSSGGRQYWSEFSRKIFISGDAHLRVNYTADASGGSNKGPTNDEYLAEVEARIDTFLVHHPYLSRKDVPAEMVTASGSGLDPHITPACAYVQVKRVAQARGMNEAEVKAIVDKNISKPFLGVFGTETVNVLELNIALEEADQNK